MFVEVSRQTVQFTRQKSGFWCR